MHGFHDTGAARAFVEPGPQVRDLLRVEQVDLVQHDQVRGRKLLLDDVSDAVLVGGFVKVRITTEEHHDALSIPKLALVEEGALRSAFVAEADTVRKVEIETGLYDETHVEVLEGLFDGDYVVTMGQGGLRTGSPVKALNGVEVGYREPEEEAAPPSEGADPAADSAPVTALAESE